MLDLDRADTKAGGDEGKRRKGGGEERVSEIILGG